MFCHHIKVSKESILRELDISDFPVNFYKDDVSFDAGGVAKITCENTASGSVVDVNCRPNEVRI